MTSARLDSAADHESAAKPETM